MRWLSVSLMLLAGCAGGTPNSAVYPVPPGDASPGVDVLGSVDGNAGDGAPRDAGRGSAVDAVTDTGMDASVEPGDGGRAMEASVPGDTGTGRTTFRVHYPDHAGGMSLRGSGGGLNWDHGVPFTRAADGTWTWTSDTLSTPIEWKPLLDDATWSRGPNYRVSPGTTVDVWPHFVTVHGSYTRRWPSFVSTRLGNTRGVWVYLPPTYDENPTARFPVVYMQDGQNLFDPAAAFGGNTWQAAQAMDTGAEDGSIREAILVGVENTAARIDEYTPTVDATQMAGGHGEQYLQMLITELKPQVDGALRTLTGPADTALAGSSLGALISLYAGVHHAAVFGLIGALSPSTWWDNAMILREVPMVTASPVRPLRVYVDSGDSGPSMDDVDNTRALAATWRTLGYVDGMTLDYLVQAGGMHNEVFWAQRLPGALHFLLGARQP